MGPRAVVALAAGDTVESGGPDERERGEAGTGMGSVTAGELGLSADDAMVLADMRRGGGHSRVAAPTKTAGSAMGWTEGQAGFAVASVTLTIFVPLLLYF